MVLKHFCLYVQGKYGTILQSLTSNNKINDCVNLIYARVFILLNHYNDIYLFLQLTYTLVLPISAGCKKIQNRAFWAQGYKTFHAQLPEHEILNAH